MEGSGHTKPNVLLRRQRQQRGWSLQRVADEIRRLCEVEDRRVGITAHMVGTWERGTKRPSPLYREKLCMLYREPAGRLGFLDPAGPEPAPMRHHHAMEDAQAAMVDGAILDDLLRHDEPGTPGTSPRAPGRASGAPDLDAHAQDRATAPATCAAETPDTRGSDMRRRTFLHGFASATGAALAGPSLAILGDEPWARLSMALERPRAADLAVVRDLEAITATYSQLTTRVSPSGLLKPVLAHMRTVTDLLQGGQHPALVRTRLCAAAAEIAQLAGWLLFDDHDRSLARAYHEVALDAARQADGRDLSAYVLGSMSFLPNSLERPRDALRLLEQAEQVADAGRSAKIRSWLSAVTAETHAKLGDERAALTALGRADEHMDRADEQTGPHWLRYFDRSFLSGYHGVCHLLLERPKQAQNALETALDAQPPGEVKHRTVILIDLASAHVAQRDPAAACDLAEQACDLILCETIKARLRDLRSQLDPWDRTVPVRQLDERLHAVAV